MSRPGRDVRCRTVPEHGVITAAVAVSGLLCGMSRQLAYDGWRRGRHGGTGMRIGIDLGGTTVSVGLVNDHYEIVDKTESLSHCGEGAEAVTERMAGMTEQLLQRAGNPPLSHIGLGCPGVLDRKNGVVIYSNNIQWQQVPVRQKLEERFRVPVWLENDANCAAVGEYYAGAGRGSSSMVMVTLGTGIGGGIILGGKLYLGKHGNAGIVGHLLFRKDGRECSCQRKGCWERYASTKALLAAAGREGVFDGLSEERIDGRAFFELLEAGQEAAGRVFEEYVDYVAEGIADLVNILDPDRIVIGGGISAQRERFLIPVTEYVKKKVFFAETETADIVCSVLANDAAVIGAA